jgi:hypothetical protein
VIVSVALQGGLVTTDAGGLRLPMRAVETEPGRLAFDSDRSMKGSAGAPSDREHPQTEPASPTSRVCSGASVNYPQTGETAMGFTSGLSSTGTAGQIKVTNQGTAIDLVVDVIGYYAATTSGSGSFTPAASRIAGAVVVAGGAT